MSAVPPKPATRRIHGYDLARAIAIFGMIAAHFTPAVYPGDWLSNGYPSALFAVLVGVSTAIILTNRPHLATSYGYGVRATLILLLGLALSLWPSMIMVVLTTIAIEMLVLVLIHHWSSRRLVITLAILILAGPAVKALATVFSYEPLIGGAYPLLAWIAYGVGGILVHRLLQAHKNIALVLVAVGFLAVAAAYPFRASSKDTSGVSTAMYSPSQPVEAKDFTDSKDFIEPKAPSALLDYFAVNAHSGGLFDVLTTLLGAAGMIALCVLLCRWIPLVFVTYPLRAIGTMPLTIYTLHVITEPLLTHVFGNEFGPSKKPDTTGQYVPDMPWEIYQDKVAHSVDYPTLWDKEQLWWDGFYQDKPALFIDEPSLQTGEFLVTVIVAVAFASLWKIWLRQGPLEWALAATVRRAIKVHSADLSRGATSSQRLEQQ
ncbi:hypothetical protein [Corynebacterium cystitidis]|uniref:Uncharacterized membrane protein YeiB n=1 Tax=Corynebacterium cystitidis DSM 20524 TaxID=1121357 RepID=A0A1H9VEA5_9CORY|nr:hypothetical protein [Corynebacterium cystitidis]WJY82259.1 hypothetical protein CCYS_06640 [Corynebacterium cystitidis DSM 20524]SES19889.1 Uncharacterized membrane protein YeiB [Corynebacterium cystitidis DSM 20524]SNV77181.1 membrane protein [Corynebacterium cystitidis]